MMSVGKSYRVTKYDETKCPSYQETKGKCTFCDSLKKRVGKVGTVKNIYSQTVVRLQFEDGTQDSFDVECLEEVVEEVVKNKFKVGAWYKVREGYHQEGQVFQCTSESGDLGALKGRSGWACDYAVDEVPEPVCIPADQLNGFEVGKYYKVKPYWSRAGGVFKCSAVYEGGTSADLDGRSFPDGSKSMWQVVACEVPEHLVPVAPIPVASAAPVASSPVELSGQLSMLRGQLSALRAQLIKEQESKVVAEKLSLDRQVLLDKTQEELRLTVKRAAEVEDKLLGQRNAAQKKLEESEEELLAARLELTALVQKYESASNDVDKYIAAEERHNKRYAESSQEITQQRVALEAAADEKDCLEAELEKTKQLVTNTANHLNETCKELLRLREIEDDINVRKWLVIRRHELALLLADRAVTALSGIFSRHMAALGGLVAICFTVILVAKVLHGH